MDTRVRCCSLKILFKKQIYYDSRGDINMEKSVDLCEAYDTSVEPLATGAT